MAIPQSKIYKRKNVESKKELEAKRERLLKYETADQLVPKKKKEGDKSAPGEAAKAVPPADKKASVKLAKTET